MVNRAATSLRMAANALLSCQTYLGALYRRLRTKLGAPKAITAMAHRLARLVYRMLKYGQRYVDKGARTTSKGIATNNSTSYARRRPTQFPINGGSSPDCLIQSSEVGGGGLVSGERSREVRTFVSRFQESPKW